MSHIKLLCLHLHIKTKKMKKKNVFVQFRAEPEFKEAILEAAKAHGLCISDFLRNLVTQSKECATLAA